MTAQLDRLAKVLEELERDETAGLPALASDDEDRADEYSPEKVRQLEVLNAALLSKMWEIVESISLQTGGGDPAALDEIRFRQAVMEACRAVANWSLSEDKLRPFAQPTPLQALLAEHHSLGGQILDIQDDWPAGGLLGDELEQL